MTWPAWPGLAWPGLAWPGLAWPSFVPSFSISVPSPPTHRLPHPPQLAISLPSPPPSPPASPSPTRQLFRCRSTTGLFCRTCSTLVGATGAGSIGRRSKSRWTRPRPTTSYGRSTLYEMPSYFGALSLSLRLVVEEYTAATSCRFLLLPVASFCFVLLLVSPARVQKHQRHSAT